jgi:hypothetical protein
MKKLAPEHVALLNAAVAVRAKLKRLSTTTADVATRMELYDCIGLLAVGMKARSVVRRRSAGKDEAA